MKFHQYDVVKIIDIDSNYVWQRTLGFGKSPDIGDIATIVEIYKYPIVGFELECCNKDETLWLETFSNNQVKLELIKKAEL